jgi:predicted hotdog family 3-hydroxylacyl-ACP dehydratase
MCLLDAVREWNRTWIVCTATSHADPDNPLGDGRVLPAVCGIEYAAQAMALHCGLTTGEGAPPVRGYLGSLHDLSLNVQRLDDILEPLRVEATRLFGGGHAVSYEFQISANDRVLLGGRAGVFLEQALQTV